MKSQKITQVAEWDMSFKYFMSSYGEKLGTPLCMCLSKPHLHNLHCLMQKCLVVTHSGLYLLIVEMVGIRKRTASFR